jgi:hypothetical protein
MSAELLEFPRRPDPLCATEESIGHAYAELAYCLAGFPDTLPVHRFEAMEAERLGLRLLTE